MRITPTYNANDFESNDGMLTTVWGPSIWHFLHTMSFNYPVSPTKEEKQHYMDFILQLKHVLPCGKCRKNLARNMSKHPLLMKHMASRDTLSKYIYELHEVVNKMLGKKSNLSYEQVRERYEHFRARCTLGGQKTRAVYSAGKPLQQHRTRKIQKKKEDGCTEPLYGEKAKCVLNIVPIQTKGDTLQIDKRCIKTRRPSK